jgi:hypothetical protein
MRIATVLLSSLVALLVTATALVYIPARIGQNRIYPEAAPDDSMPQSRPYRSYGYQDQPKPDSVRLAGADSDSNPQRYYSESEGWTYFTPPVNHARP